MKRCMPWLPARNGRKPSSQHGRSMRCKSRQPALDDRSPFTLPCWRLKHKGNAMLSDAMANKGTATMSSGAKGNLSIAALSTGTAHTGTTELFKGTGQIQTLMCCTKINSKRPFERVWFFVFAVWTSIVF
jgi:hypothetical protein